MADPIITRAVEIPAAERYLEQVRAAQLDAAYPELLVDTASDPMPALIYRERRQSGLIETILHHGALSEAQRQALAEFRLHQFVLCDWFEAERVAADHLTGDPGFDLLPPDTMHAVVGLSDGRILAYTCLQPAGASVSATTLDQLVAVSATTLDQLVADASTAGGDGATAATKHFFTDAVRPLFPTERELFGAHLFETLPALRSIPIEYMREWACSFRNQVVRSSLETAALMAAFTRPLLLAADPAYGIKVIVGNNNRAARKIYAALDLPVLYAPFAPVSPPTDDGYWTSGVNQQGQFWPGALAREDMAEHLKLLQQMDATLDLSPSDLRRALATALRQAERRGTAPQPRALLPLPDPHEMFWTNDPYFDDSQDCSQNGLTSTRSVSDEDMPTVVPADTSSSPSAAIAPAAAQLADDMGTHLDRRPAGTRKTPSSIRVQPVRSRRALRAWVSFPRRTVYPRSSLWAAPLDVDIRRQISPQHNPFFKHGRGAAFLARNARGRVVGRIYAHVDDRYNVRHGERAAWFGFFESIDDVDVAQALVAAAADYGVSQGCTVLRGPMSLTALETVGVVLDNFDEAASTDNTYTAPYYPALLDATGLQRIFPMSTRRVDDLGQLDPDTFLDERHRALLADGRLQIRTVNLRAVDAEIEIIRELINDAFYDSPFSVPLSREEYRFQVEPYLSWLDPSMVFIAELDAIPVAFLVAVPDYSPVLQRLRGRITPIAALGFLLRGRPHVDGAVGSLMGVQRHLRSQGIMRILLAEMLRALQRAGYKQFTYTWIADTNDRSLGATGPLDGRLLHHLSLYEGTLPLASLDNRDVGL